MKWVEIDEFIGTIFNPSLDPRFTGKCTQEAIILLTPQAGSIWRQLNDGNILAMITPSIALIFSRSFSDISPSMSMIL